jgi:hypothetical protein
MGIRLASVCYSAITICAERLIIYITVIVPVPNVLAADIFGNDIFTDI